MGDPFEIKGRRRRSTALTSDSGNGWSRGGPEVEWWIGGGGFSIWGKKGRREGVRDLSDRGREMGNGEGNWEMQMSKVSVLCSNQFGRRFRGRRVIFYN